MQQITMLKTPLLKREASSSYSGACSGLRGRERVKTGGGSIGGRREMGVVREERQSDIKREAEWSREDGNAPPTQTDEHGGPTVRLTILCT